MSSGKQRSDRKWYLPKGISQTKYHAFCHSFRHYQSSSTIHSSGARGCGIHSGKQKSPGLCPSRAHHLPGKMWEMIKMIPQIDEYNCEKCWVKGRKPGEWRWVGQIHGELRPEGHHPSVSCTWLAPAFVCAVCSGTWTPSGVGISQGVTHPRRLV